MSGGSDMAKKGKSVRNNHRRLATGEMSQKLQNGVGAFMDASVDAFLLFDENLDLLSINPAGERMLGISKEAVEGKNILDFAPEIKKTGRYDKYLDVIKTGDPFFAEDIFPHSRFGEMHLSVKAFKMRKGMGMIVNDITEHRRVEDALKHSEKYFRALIENASDAVAVVTKEGLIGYESPSFKRMLGYNPEEMKGKNSFWLVHQDDLPKAAELFTQLVQNPSETVKTEIRCRHSDGSWRMLEVVGRNLISDPMVAGIVANFRDITEQRRVEEALRESELVATATIEGMSDGVMLVSMDGKVAYINKAFEKILGYKVEEVVGTSAVELPTYRDSKDKKKAREALRRVIEKGSTEPIDVIALTKDGDEIPISFSASVIKDAQGNPKTLVAVIRDITERKRMEEALRESEEEYHCLVDWAPDIIFRWSPDKGLEYVSRAATRITGYTVEELMASPMMGMEIAKEGDERLAGDYEKVTTGEASMPSREVTLVRKDGKRVYLDLRSHAIRNEKGEFVAFEGILRDITDRKRMEEALRQSEEYFRALTENSSDAVVVLDADGTVRYEGPSTGHIWGYKSGEQIGHNGFQFVHPDDIVTVAEAFAELLQNPGISQQVEARMRHEDGSWRVLEAIGTNLLDNPAVRGIVINSRDITERKRMEEELRLLSDAVKMTTESVVIADLKGRIVDINEAGLKMYGLDDRADLVGKNPFDIIVPEDQPKALENMAKVIETGVVKDIEYHIKKKDGRKALIETSVSLIKGGKRDPKGIVAVARDITERRKAEERIKRSYEIQSVLNNLLRTSLTGISLDEQLQLFLEHIVSIDSFGLEAKGAIFLVEGEAGVLVLKAHKGLAKPLLSTCARVPFGRCLCGRAALSGEVQFADRLDERHENCYEGITQHGHYCVPILSSGKVLGVINLYVGVGHTRDEMEEGFLIAVSDVIAGIIERRRMEEELAKSEAKYRSLIETAGAGVTTIDLKGELVLVNEALCNILGYSQEELLGKNFADFLHPDDAAGILDWFSRGLKGEREKPKLEFRAIHKEGHSIWCYSSPTAIVHEHNTIGFNAIIYDIAERKRMEEALRRSEEKLRLYLDNSPDAIYIMDANAAFLYGNKTAEKFAGYLKEELIGKSFLELSLLSEEDLLKAARLFEFSLAGKPTGPDELELIRKDGSRVFVEISTYPSREGGKLEIIGIARDITERRRAEEDLRLKSNAIENAISAIAMSDMTGRITYVNKACMRLWGASNYDELIGKPYWILLEPKEVGIATEIARVMMEKHVWQGELTGRNKEGKELSVLVSSGIVTDEKGNPIHTVSSFVDITERIKAEEALRRSEEKLRLMFESITDGIVVTNLNGVIIEANEGAAQIGGFGSREGILGRSAFELIAPRHHEEAAVNMQKTLEQGSVTNMEYTLVRADGSEYPGELSAAVLEDASGNPVGFVGIIRDITERKRAEEEKKKMEEQLRLAGRLAAVGELAAGVAHELNNPLAAIQGYAQLLASSGDMEGHTKKDIEVIYREALRASKITQNLLSFARRHEPEKNLISLNEVLEKTIELHAHQMKVNNIELEVELAPDLPKTMADFHQMQQVFVNLINNAEQAMVETHGKGRLVIRTQKTDGMIQVSFKDNGPGISEENMKRVFDPFFTTKEVGKGTGLGLSICYGIVEAHGGRIYARSKLGEGVTFVVELPIVSGREK